MMSPKSTFIKGKNNSENIIILDNNLGDELCVALVQIESPFNFELSEGNDPHNHDKKRTILFWKDTVNRSSKIMKIVSSIINRYNDLHIISFPEYSVPKDCWNDLKSVSDNHNIIIIGGSDYIANIYKNICPIFIPGRDTIYLVKSSHSFYESNIYFSTKAVNKPNYFSSTVKLTWTSISQTKYEIQVFICKDYFQSPCQVDADIIGVIICPMCSSNVRRFYGLAEHLISLNKPKYILLNNACSGAVPTSKIPGNYGICCSLPSTLQEYPQLSNQEGVIYAKLNLHSARIEKPKSTSNLMPITNVERIPIYYENDNPYLCFSCGDEIIERAILNPDLFRVLGKKFRIYYLRCKTYREALSEIQKSNTYAVGVLGDVDIIVRNINDASGKLRDYDLYKASQFFMTEQWPYFSVDRFIKYDGQVVKSGVNAIDSPPDNDELMKLIQLVKGQIGNVSEEEIDSYLSNKWLIGHSKECEDATNIRAIINVFLPDISPTNDILNRFDNEVLTAFCTDNKISGIYEGKSRGINSNYVLEACCNVNDLFGIVESIHSNAAAKNIRINTNTYIISKRVVIDLYSSVLVPSVPFEISNIIDNHIIKDMGQGFCNHIRLLTMEEQKYLTQFYIRVNKLHGIATQYIGNNANLDIRSMYPNVRDVIEEVRKEFTTYLVYRGNINKIASSFNNVFAIYDVYYQELVKAIINRYFDGRYGDLITNIDDTYKLSSPKPDPSRLTIFERSKLVKGAYHFMKDRELPFFKCEIMEPEEFQKMVNYRNILQHRKAEEIEKLLIEDIIDVTLKMIRYITPEIVSILRFPNIPKK